jgi:hypothetical protein
MKIVIPLAGPDFESPNGGVKSEAVVNGTPLLRAALEQRFWWRNGDVSCKDLIFILRDTDRSGAFAATSLARWYPNSRVVKVSGDTRGAAFSALAGVALVSDPEEVLCIDLVDILYECEVDPVAEMRRNEADAMAVVFQSTNPSYSYLRTDISGRVVHVAEKQVISTNASVGTYFFASAAVFLEGLARNLRRGIKDAYRGVFFVAPVLEGVIHNGGKVLIKNASDIADIKF